MEDAYLAARAEDVGEVGARLIRHLLHQHHNPFASVPEGSVVIAEEITPADMALMEPGCVAGIATVLGGAEGHAAIMARALGLPAIAGLPELMRDVKTGEQVVIDGRKGEIFARPTAEVLHHYKQELANKQREDKKLKGLRDSPAVTSDGTAIALEANIELPRDVETAIEAGAVGIGLLRTEFMFMNRPDLPDEDEQFESLRKVVQTLEGRVLTVRTLDIGGEKLAAALGDMAARAPIRP